MRHPKTGEELMCVKLRDVHGMVRGPSGINNVIPTICSADELWLPCEVLAEAIVTHVEGGSGNRDGAILYAQSVLRRLGVKDSAGAAAPSAPGSFQDGALAMREAIRTAAYDAVQRGDPPLSSFRIGEVPAPKPKAPAASQMPPGVAPCCSYPTYHAQSQTCMQCGQPWRRSP